jgi:hypothetical protein
MCFFVVVGVPTQYVRNCLAKVPRPVRADHNGNYGGLTVHLPDHELNVLTEGGCSCSLYAPRREERATRPERLRKKWRKRGWSEQKIERALSDIKATPVVEPGLRLDVRTWIADSADECGEFAVFVHWASDKIPRSPERIEVSASEVRSAGEVIAEGMLVRVVRTRQTQTLSNCASRS